LQNHLLPNIDTWVKRQFYSLAGDFLSV